MIEIPVRIAVPQLASLQRAIDHMEEFAAEQRASVQQETVQLTVENVTRAYDQWRALAEEERRSYMRRVYGIKFPGDRGYRWYHLRELVWRLRAWMR